MKIALVLPTYNAGRDFFEVMKCIDQQRENIDLVKIVDSYSTDDTVEIAKQFKCEIEIIKKSDFSHGGTRRKIAIEFYELGYDYLILMTQDVFLQENAVNNLIDFISSDNLLGAVFGKQEVDLEKGNLFEYYARSFNYPNLSYKRNFSDISKYGIKTIFNSDAFAAYNLKVLKEIDFFEDKQNFAEDMFIAHKIVQSGSSIGYCANAKVYHTHDYSVLDEYKRYREIGKFYKQNATILNKYGKTTSNGIKLVIGEINFLIKRRKILLIPKSILRNMAKFIGHKVGYYSNKNNTH